MMPSLQLASNQSRKVELKHVPGWSEGEGDADRRDVRSARKHFAT